MAQTTIPALVTDALEKVIALSQHYGYYCALVNSALGQSEIDRHSANAENAKKELVLAKGEFQFVLESYGSQLYEGGLELGRAEGAHS